MAIAAHAQTPQVSGKSTHTLGLDVFGVAYGWGSDSFGQLGSGRTVYVPFPAKIQNVPQMTWASAGREHVAAIDATGLVWTWGASSDGKLGSRTGPDPDVPRRVVGIAGVVDVAAGGTFTVALRSDGTVWYWGTLPGVGSTLAPMRVLAVPTATQIAAGDGHFVARLSDGRVWVAGRNNFGQLGLGHAASPVTGQIHPTLTGIARVAAMDYSSAALKAGAPNVPYGWGLYFPSMVPTTPAPGQFPPGANFGDVAVQGNFPTVLLTNGDIWQWTGTAVDSGHPGGAVPVGGTPNVWNQGGTNPMGGLGTGINHVYGWDTSFNLFAFGFNADGALGTGNLNDAYPVPAAVPTHKFVLVRGGFNYAVGIKSDGSVWAWGSNSSGQLGNARYLACDMPDVITCGDPAQLVNANDQARVATRPREVVLDSPDTLVQVSAGYGFSLARTINNTVISWGVNSSGQLGQGDYVSSSRPRPIAGLTTVIDIAASSGHALFLKSNGTVWETGGLANVSSLTTTPRQVSFPEPITRVFAGEGKAFAVTAAGRLYAWGNNFWGELGFGDSSARSTPTLIPGSGTGSLIVREIASGPTHTLARLADGRVFAWGENNWGQLGLGSFTPQASPQQVPGIAGAVSIAAGLRFSMVALSDGTMRAFGRNDAGQLGDGTSDPFRTSPVTVDDLDDATNSDATKRAIIEQVTAGYNTAVALRLGGTVYAWGTSGTSPDQTIQEIETLGDGKIVPRNRPSLVLAATDDGPAGQRRRLVPGPRRAAAGQPPGLHQPQHRADRARLRLGRRGLARLGHQLPPRRLRKDRGHLRDGPRAARVPQRGEGHARHEPRQGDEGRRAGAGDAHPRRVDDGHGPARGVHDLDDQRQRGREQHPRRHPDGRAHRRQVLHRLRGDRGQHDRAADAGRGAGPSRGGRQRGRHSLPGGRRVRERPAVVELRLARHLQGDRDRHIAHRQRHLPRLRGDDLGADRHRLPRARATRRWRPPSSPPARSCRGSTRSRSPTTATRRTPPPTPRTA